MLRISRESHAPYDPKGTFVGAAVPKRRAKARSFAMQVAVLVKNEEARTGYLSFVLVAVQTVRVVLTAK